MLADLIAGANAYLESIVYKRLMLLAGNDVPVPVPVQSLPKGVVSKVNP